MKKFIKIVLPILAVAFVATAFLTNGNVSATYTMADGAEAARCTDCPKDLFGETGIFRQITDTILYIVGIIAVIMLIWGGLRYVLSGGDSKKVTDAKNTILYAIIGLIISFLAYAIVHFIITALPSGDTEKTEEEETSLVLPAHC